MTYTVTITRSGTSAGTSTTSQGDIYSPVAFTAYSFLVNLAAGSTVVHFNVALVTPAGTDESGFIDNVSLTPVPESSTIAASASLLLPLFASIVRIVRKNEIV